MMKTKLILYSIVFFLFSCKTSKDIVYFQNIDDSSIQKHIAEASTSYSAKICPDDMLAITVSGLDPNSVAPFNLPAMTFLSPGEKSLSFSPNMQTYLVDVEGNIDFPVLGKLNLGGKTKREAIDYLQSRISEYVKKPLVNIQFMNYRISVLGEVNKPGTIVLPNERITILDAVGLAGDLTIYGERKNVLLIRDVNGKKEFHRFDLTRSDLFSSPYYYLQQNDIVYVEPNNPRIKNSRFSQTDQYNLSLVSVVVSAVSVIASLLIALTVK